MKNKRLLNIIGEIDDRHIAEAAPARPHLKTAIKRASSTILATPDTTVT